MPHTENLRRALRTPEAAHYLGVSPSYLRNMRSRGLPGPVGIKISSRLVVYDIAELDRWLDTYARGLA